MRALAWLLLLAATAAGASRAEEAGGVPATPVALTVTPSTAASTATATSVEPVADNAPPGTSLANAFAAAQASAWAAAKAAGQALQTEDVVGEGLASWYGPRFHGRRTASGERFDMHAFTAAHPFLPFGTIVKVRSLLNGREVQVRINDRGPYTGQRIIDLSRAAAAALGLLQSGQGTKPVVITLPAVPSAAPAPQRP